MLGDLVEELGVGAERLEAVDEQFQPGGGVAVGGKAAEHAAQLPHHLQLLAVEQQLLVASARRVDVDRRVDPSLGESPVEPQLHVAGALELLEDRLVHPAVRLDEGRGENRERAALLDVARGAEELLRRVQRTGVDTAGEDPPARRCGEVVGPAEPGDPVEDHDDVVALLDEPLGLLDRQLGDVGVLVARAVERRGDHLAALDVAAHVGDLLGPLVDEQHDHLDLRVVALDRLHDRLHDRRLAGLRRRHDHATLALADRTHKVDDPRRHVGGVGGILEVEVLVGEQGGEVLEARPLARQLWVGAVDRQHVEQCRVLLVATGRATRTGDLIALAQPVLAGELDRDVGVLATREVTLHAQEAVSLVAHVDVARHLDRLVGHRL